MANLRKMAEEAGFSHPRTWVATGNLIVASSENLEISTVEQRLESGIAKVFGKQIDVLARRSAQWKALAAANPFPEESATNGGQVIVRVMRSPLAADVAERLERYRTPPEQIAVVNGDLWLSFAGKPSESRLLSQLTTAKLGIGTMRNWNTVKALADMLD